MKLSELEEKIKGNPNVIKFKVMHDLNDKVIYSYVYNVGDIAYEGGFTVYVKNRGLDNEKIYFLGSPPPFLTTPLTLSEIEKRRDEIVKSCDLDLVERFEYNREGNFAIIVGFKLFGDKYQRKTYIATLKDNIVNVNELV